VASEELLDISGLNRLLCAPLLLVKTGALAFFDRALRGAGSP